MLHLIHTKYQLWNNSKHEVGIWTYEKFNPILPKLQFVFYSATKKINKNAEISINDFSQSIIIPIS